MFVCFFQGKLGYQNILAAGVSLDCVNSIMTSKPREKNKTKMEINEFIPKKVQKNKIKLFFPPKMYLLNFTLITRIEDNKEQVRCQRVGTQQCKHVQYKLVQQSNTLCFSPRVQSGYPLVSRGEYNTMAK